MSPTIGTVPTGSVIVIVDDDSAVLDSLRFALRIEGFSIHAFSSGEQLLAEASQLDADCYIVDQEMPEMFGLDLITALRDRDIDAPAILITTSPSAPVRRRAAQAGIPIVEKPFLDLTLIDSVRCLLAGGIFRTG